jgi:ketosteroid isomerase-like protein
MGDADRGSQRLAVVAALARALDAEDYGAARRCLAEDCEYEAPAERILGADRVIASYAGSGAWARRTFDEVRYESAVEPIDADRAAVLFTDYLLRAGGRWHRYRCRQEFTVRDGRITRIVHREIPEERAALEAYFREAGIERGR